MKDISASWEDYVDQYQIEHGPIDEDEQERIRPIFEDGYLAGFADASEEIALAKPDFDEGME